jgi:tRNA-(ms[2]io[6]A)-hydroxylase
MDRAALSDAATAFLACSSPAAWLAAAAQNLATVLIDHANCEMKAASTALGFIYRYPEDRDLATRMSRLAREELRHFEQVQSLLDRRGIAPAYVSASRYAAGLHEAVARSEPERLLDSLLVGAFIEARSCERFEQLAGFVDGELARFYRGLLASEAGHFQVYLALAQSRAPHDYPLAERVAALRSEPDSQLRFHSGPPVQPRGSA